MNFEEGLEESFITVNQSMNDSINSTVNDMDWSKISVIKGKDYLKCPLRHELKDICINKNCKTENSLICLQDECCFRSSHSMCARQPVLGINSMIQQKILSIDTIKFEAEIFFDKKQQQLKELRAEMMRKIDKMQETSFSEAELKFKRFTDSKDTSMSFRQIGCKESMALIANQEAYQKRGSDHSVKRVHAAFATFSESLQMAFDQLKTDFKQMNDDAKNPSIVERKRLNQGATIPVSPSFNKKTQVLKNPNPQMSGRKKFTDFISPQLSNRLRPSSKQRIGERENIFQRSGQKGLSRNESRRSLSRNENEAQKNQKSSKEKLPKWK